MDVATWQRAKIQGEIEAQAGLVATWQQTAAKCDLKGLE